VLAVFGRPTEGSKLGDVWFWVLCGGENMPLSWATMLLLPPVLVEWWLGVYCELFADVDLSSLEATRVIGGN